MTSSFERLMVAVAFLLAAAVQSEARVVGLKIEKVEPVASGASFGDVGPYERLTGTLRFEVDPRDPLNAVIVNIDKAPKNAKGFVEFSAPFVIIKPKDIARGNGTTPQSALRMWLDSSGHRKHLVGTEMNHIGVGVANGSCFFGPCTYFVQCFSRWPQ